MMLAAATFATLEQLFQHLSIDGVKEWIAGHGWWGGAFISFGLLFSCGFGLPLPEDIPLILSGALLCHDPHGGPIWQEWAIVGVLNWLGIIGGDCCLYWISRKVGRGVTKLPVIRNHITLDRIDIVGGWFRQYGIGVVAVGRLLAGVRGAMVITAGITKYHFAKFIVADSIAAIFSGALFMLLGWWLGDKVNDENIKHYKHYFVLGAAALLVVLVIYVLVRTRMHAAKKPPAA